MPPTLLSIQIGQPRDRQPTAGDTSDKPWRTAFYKQPVEGAKQVTHLGVVGDGVADSKNHGGRDKAVCVYSADHAAYWRERLGLDGPFGPAPFGENFTVSGLTEPEVSIGDRWRIGTAEFEVSQPRQPCWKLARRWKQKELALWSQETGYTGWYLRVVTDGEVTAGDPIVVAERPLPEWTIERANRVMYASKDDKDANAELIAVGPLSESWKDQLGKRLDSISKL